jgi:hypothetical protein
LNYIKRQGEELQAQKKANEEEARSMLHQLDEAYRSRVYGSKNTNNSNSSATGGRRYMDPNYGYVPLGDPITYEGYELLHAQKQLNEAEEEFFERLKKLHDEGVDIDKMLEEFAEETRETFTGSPYQSILDGIVEGFESGKRSAADFADSFETLMKNALTSALEMKADERVREWYEQFAMLAQDEEGLTKDEIETLRISYENIINALNAEASQLEKIAGMELSSEINRSLEGAIKGVTEETAGLIAGQMNAIRVMQADSLALQQHQLDTQINLSDLTRQSLGVLRDSLLYHQEIAGNTSYLIQISEMVKDIAQNSGKIQTDYGRSQGW